MRWMIEKSGAVELQHDLHHRVETECAVLVIVRECQIPDRALAIHEVPQKCTLLRQLQVARSPRVLENVNRLAIARGLAFHDPVVDAPRALPLQGELEEIITAFGVVAKHRFEVFPAQPQYLGGFEGADRGGTRLIGQESLLAERLAGSESN